MALFLTFEGLDGSGKSTHLRRAAEWLGARGETVDLTREPGGTELGDAIRGVFLDPRWGEIDGRVEALLVFASRRQHLLERIEPALAAGVHVLCDRFTDSSLAYQGAGRDLDASWVLALDRLATGDGKAIPATPGPLRAGVVGSGGVGPGGGRRPDRTFLFDLPPDVAMGRGQKPDRSSGPPDRLDVESLAFYTRVRDAYLALADSEPERFVRIDSSGETADTWKQVEAALEALFPNLAPVDPRGNR